MTTKWKETLYGRLNELDRLYRETHKTEYLMEDDTICHVLGNTGAIYESIARFCNEHSIERVVDIGCAYGHQSEIFYEQGIDYTGVSDGKHEFWKDHGNYFVQRYPAEIPVKEGDLGVSVFCLGWNVYLYEGDKTLREQCEALKKDFKHCLIHVNSESLNMLSNYFEKVIHVEDKLYYFSN